jgi:hypothetical protein
VTRALTASAFVLLLAAFLLRAYPCPATIDSLSCAISVAELRPGFLDGKPTYAFLGQIPRLLNAALGGDRAGLMRGLSLWCALFAWGMLVIVYLLARDLHGGSRPRGWAAAALLASSPIYVFMAAIVEKYTVAIFLLLLSALLWTRRRYAAWGIAWGLAIGAHVTSILLLVPCAVSLLADPSRRSERRRAIAGGAIAAAVSLPLYLWVLSCAQGVGIYFGYLGDLVFREYAFMKALRPDRLLASAVSDPLRGASVLAALLALLAAGIAVVRRRSRIPGDRGRVAAATGSSARGAGIAASIVSAIAVAVVAWAYSRNLAPLCALAGIPLLAIGALRLALLFVHRVREGGEGGPAGQAGDDPSIATFVLPWLVTNALFFVAWDHFYGQFSVYIAPPLALLAAGVGAGGRRGSRAGWTLRWDVVAIVAAVLCGMWISRDVVDRTRWKMTGENDAWARAIAPVIPEGSLVIAGWDGVNLAYHAPGFETLSIVAGEASRSIVWKGKARHTDLAGDVRRALMEGRRVYVTRRFLDQPGDAGLREAQEALRGVFDFNPAGPGLLELSPRRASACPPGASSARMVAHEG